MNQREKVLAALTHMLEQQTNLEQAERVLECCRQNRQEAEAELMRVIKAVYGSRCEDGVVYKSRRYYITEGRLACVEMAAEVLG